jgi:type VI protein secretion system component Hcp
VSGKIYTPGKIDVTRRINDRNAVFMSYALFNVRITSYSVRYEASTIVPIEEVAFSFGRILWSYTPYNAQGGALKSIQGGWDLEKNQPV